MSKLDKDKVLGEFSAAFEAAEGKKPKVEESNGWFSVNGGKNMRLAKLAEWTEELGGAKPKSTEKKAALKKKPEATKKATPKKSSSGGLSAKELWAQKLASEEGQSRLPRGF
ncbi:MAG: hypothetical protein HLUCCO02_02580 [Idiomarinaceae bacterium HL-53]|nr:MAG: hypothetical protein HLUCCO02_02580 [Idiomarinaceae bacterium HL-53]CUS48906.1 hypothetical protein Ga0003345_1887 [Idiomarinaceae bacterium HL-53]